MQIQELPVPPQDMVTVAYTRQRRGRPSLPKDLPREPVDYDLSDAEKAEFDALERIGGGGSSISLIGQSSFPGPTLGSTPAASGHSSRRK